MTFTTTHLINFTVADIDWAADISITSDRHDTVARVSYIFADLGGRSGVDIEGDAMKVHGALVDGQWKSLLDIATEAMNAKLGDLIDSHNAEESETAADRKAEARRDMEAA